MSDKRFFESLNAQTRILWRRHAKMLTSPMWTPFRVFYSIAQRPLSSTAQALPASQMWMLANLRKRSVSLQTQFCPAEYVKHAIEQEYPSDMFPVVASFQD
jgi:hypothetical protein